MSKYDITGEGGKGGAARQAIEAENTLQTDVVINVLEVISEGEIVGIVNGYKDVYINNIPVENNDGSKNFPDIVGDYRVGLPVQDPIKGFEEISAVFSSGVEVTQANPVTIDLEGENIDSVIITLGFNNGFYTRNRDNGNLDGHKITVEIWLKKLAPSIGTLYKAATYTIDGKQDSAYETDRRLDAPEGATKWRFKVVRVSDDDSGTHESSTFHISRWVEVQSFNAEGEEPLTYPDTALAALSIPSSAVGNQIPSRGYLVKGIICQVPTNYTWTKDVTVSSFSGSWDGNFKAAWTDNNAIVLHELITNPRFGLGEYIGEATKTDKWSFYDAAVYNDGAVPNGTGGFERRNTFNAVIATQQDAWQLLQTVASTMQAVIFVNGRNEIAVIQDRPTPSSKILTNSSVVNGIFTYSSSDISERPTAVNCTFNDKEDKYLPRTISEPKEYDSDFIPFMEKYGYNPIDVVGYGMVTESRARRFCRWTLYAAHYEEDNVTFHMGSNIVGLELGDVVTIMDNDYIAADNLTNLAGRVVSLDATRKIVTLDTEVNISQSNYKFVVADLAYTGTTERTISGSGTTDVITLTSTLPAGDYTGHEFYCYKSGVIEPRQFRIVKITEEDSGKYSLLCTFYDPQKWGVIEDKLEVIPYNYTLVKPLDPITGLTVEEDFMNDDLISTNIMRLTWDYNPKHLRYEFWIRHNNGTPMYYPTSERYLEFTNILVGAYEIVGRAIGLSRTLSPKTYLSYSYGIGGATILPPIELEVEGGGSTFNSKAVTFTWKENPANNVGELKDYIARVYTTGNTLKGEYIIPYNVDKGSVFYRGGRQLYSHEAILANFGEAPRTFKVKLASRDLIGRESTELSLTVNNPAPALPGAASTVTGFGRNVIITLDPTDTVDDAAEVLVAYGASGFTPTLQQIAFRVPATAAYDGAVVTVPAEGTYYIRFAVSDTYNDADLNWTTQFTIVIADGSDVLIFPTPTTPTGLGIDQVTSVDTDGKVIITNTFYWTPVNDSVSTYTVGWKNVTDGDTEYSYIDVSEPRIVLPIWLSGKNIDAVVRANFGDSYSPYSSVFSFSTVGDTTPPDRPYNLVVSTGSDIVTLTWDRPPQEDYSYTEILYSETDNRGTANVIATVGGSSHSFYAPPGQIGYFWAKSVDTTGNKSVTYPNTLNGIVGTTSGVSYDDILGTKPPSDATNGAPEGTLVGGVLSETLIAEIDTLTIDYNASNNANYSAITAPSIATNGSAVNHVLNSNGSADIYFTWSWAGDEKDIDGFAVFYIAKTTGADYNFGTNPAIEYISQVPANKRTFSLMGVLPSNYYTFGVEAYRKVTPKSPEAPAGIIISPLVQPTISSEDGYRPSATVAFNGDTVNGIPVDDLNDWAALSDSLGTRPEDNATVGADWDTNVTNKPVITQTFYQETTPTGNQGDYWIKTSTGQLYILDGTWALIQDEDINAAFQLAQSAESLADSKIVTFAQTTAPTGGVSSVGDIWIDTLHDNKIYRYNGSTWVNLRDGGIQTALEDSSNALALVDGKIVTFIQATAPTSTAIGDLWIDSAHGYKLYRASVKNSNTNWVNIQDTAITDAQQEASTAIADALTAQNTADGKITTFVQASRPTSVSAGDLWFETDNNNKLYRALAAGSSTVGNWVAYAQDYADWAKVFDTSGTKPDDNATEGAPNGTSVGGIPVETLVTNLNNLVVDYNASNNTNYTSIATPTVTSNAVIHALANNGSADVQFSWAWAGQEKEIDGFAVIVRHSRTDEAAYNIYSQPANETAYQLPADKRNFTINLPATSYITFGVLAYRKVTPKAGDAPDGVILSSLVQPYATSEDPYRPDTQGDFSGIRVGRNYAPALGTWTHSNSLSEIVLAAEAYSGYAIHIIPGSGTAKAQVPIKPLTLGDNYILSFRGYTWSGTQNIEVDLYPDTLPGTVFTLTTNDQKFEYIFNSNHTDMDSNDILLRFFDINPAKDTIIYNVKLEKGSLPTPMSYNEGDLVSVDNIINSGNVDKFISAGVITAREIYAGEVTAEKIQASQLNVTKLSAITGDIGDIDAGTITGAIINSTKYIYSTSNAALPDGTFAAIGGIGINTIGVYGKSNSDVGIYGTCTGTAISARGVHGAGAGGDSTGVYATNYSTGIALRCNGIMTKTGVERVDNLNADLLDSFTSSAFPTWIDCENSTAAGVSNYNFRMRTDVTGVDIVGSGNTVTITAVSSDERLKEEIEPEVLGLDFINSLKPITFKFINGKPAPITGERLKHHGFKAQDVQATLGISPNYDTLLARSEETGMLKVDYPSFISPTVKAVQELDAKLEAALARIDELTKLVDTLTKGK